MNIISRSNIIIKFLAVILIALLFALNSPATQPARPALEIYPADTRVIWINAGGQTWPMEYDDEAMLRESDPMEAII